MSLLAQRYMGSLLQRESVSRRITSAPVTARHAAVVRQAPAPQQQSSRNRFAAAAKRSSRRDDDSAEVEADRIIDDTAADAIDAVSETADATQQRMQAAAAAATGAVSDASDAAQATITTAAQTATGIVSDAADTTAALIDDADAILKSGVDSVRAATTPGGPIDWSVGVGGSPDPRFKKMKVLVVGSTGGVGRRVVAALRAKGVPCRALVRDRARAANLLPEPSPAAVSSSGSSGSNTAPEFDIVTGDVYQYATLPPALKGCNAVIVASGANDKADPLGPFNVDYNGNLNLIAAAKAAGVKHFVLVTSIGTDDILNPLNLFWGILFWKKRAEEALQRSGLPHTIVRPGGLKSRLGAGESTAGNIVMGRAGSYGFPPLQKSGSILRSQVADVCVEALVCPAAEGKVVEVIAEKDAVAFSIGTLFEGVSMTWP